MINLYKKKKYPATKKIMGHKINKKYSTFVLYISILGNETSHGLTFIFAFNVTHLYLYICLICQNY